MLWCFVLGKENLPKAYVTVQAIIQNFHAMVKIRFQLCVANLLCSVLFPDIRMTQRIQTVVTQKPVEIHGAHFGRGGLQSRTGSGEKFPAGLLVEGGAHVSRMYCFELPKAFGCSAGISDQNADRENRYVL